jgi:glycosyltransferase involved in cell wall biosynthesis
LDLAGNDPTHFQYVEHPGHVNRGLPASRNVALELAEGDFIAYLDIDDIWLPNKLQRQVAALLEHPDVAMVHNPMHFWYSWTGRAEDAAREFLNGVLSPTDMRIEPPSGLLTHIVRGDGLPAPCSFLMRRQVIDDGIRHEEDAVMYEDEMFFSKIALRYPMYYMREVMDRYRQHDDSMSAQAIRAGDFVPGQPNRARERYLRWLKSYVAANGADPALLGAIEQQLEVYRPT